VSPENASPDSVVIVGAGQAGSDTAAALRSRGYAGPVTLIGAEDAVPYQRPPLSKGYLTGAVGRSEVELRPDSFYTTQGIDFVCDDRAVAIDRAARTVTLASGAELSYGALVLATGARPRRIATPGAGLDGVLALRSLADADVLRDHLDRAGHVLVIGGGFIGLEIAATTRARGCEVTVVEAAPRVMGRAVSEPMAEYLTGAHRKEGTRVLLGRSVSALQGDPAGRVRAAQLDDGHRTPADLVVIGVGVLPNTALAAEAGLAVGDGILVDSGLSTSDPHIYAIGDCARFPYGDGMVRLESVQNASDQARHVAARLAGGDPGPYTAVPWFWTDQYTVKLQIAGLTAGHDRAVVAGDPGSGRFTVFCFAGSRLLGAESVNRTADHVITRRLLAAGHTGLTPDVVAQPGFDLKTYQRQPA